MSDTEIAIVWFGIMALMTGIMIIIMCIRDWRANRKLRKCTKDEEDES